MHRHLTTVCALSILILCTLTLTFSTQAKRTFYTTQSPSSISVALSSSGAVASAFSVHSSRNYPVAVLQNPVAADDVVWVEDGLPAGATADGSFEGWNWTSTNPSPFSGTLAHTSDIVAGVHQHYFYNATQTLTVNAGDTLIAHVYLDPANPPTAVMLQFNDGTWEHRAYWGANQFDLWGTDGTVSRRNMGALPPAGQWVRLEVPASSVGLEGRTLNGMAFSLFNGRATWDRAGKSTGTPVISISDVNVNEGNSGTTSAVFTVTLSSASTQTISVNYATANDTGTSPSDYVGGSGTVTFAPGQTSKPITIQVVGDTAGELTESFFVNLSSPVNATLADNQAIGAILNDDAQPSISDDVVWVEDAVPAGATAMGHFEGWNWTSSNPPPFSGSLAHTSDIVAGVHQHLFFNATQTLTVNAGDTLIAYIHLDPANPPTAVMLQFNDGIWEHRAYWGANQFDLWGTDGTVSRRNMGALPPAGQWVRLEVPASLVGLEGRTLNGMAFSLFNGRAVWDRVGKYAAAPVIPAVSISDVSVNEGNSGNTSAVFNVTLSSASTQTISVSYATANGTATSPSDYVGATGTLVFAPGQTSQPLGVPVVGDTVFEANENFFLNVSNPVNATLADNQGVGTIVDDDAPPTISISDVSVNEGNSGTTPAEFTVTLSSASTQTVSVNYATANGTATSSSDYVAANGTLTFAPGQTSQPLAIPVVGDTVVEANENFFVNLTSPINATLANGQGVCTIQNLSYFEIPVYFHVIRDTDGAGDVADSRLDAQIDVLNSAFNGINVGNIQFFFRKMGVTRDTNHDWFMMRLVSEQDESGAEYEAKRVLRQGGANALNIYTISSVPPPGVPFPIGWGLFPENYAGNPCRDGVVIPFTTLPGVDPNNPNNPFNLGDLPVHEVGHWLGLFHTFGSSCSQADPDQVADTPAHLNSNIGQCVEEDTCPSQPGTDPIHNYMTNTSDACKSEFTRGQFERMRDQYLAFRQSSTPPQCSIVTMSISDVTVNEGNSGNTSATFTVTLSMPSTKRIGVSFATANGTASGGSDYIALSGGTVNFDPRQTSISLSINVLGDTAVEANETFFVNLSEPRNVKIADGQGLGTIINDDSLPAISINDATAIEGNPVVFNVTLSSASTQTISVNYATANGTASSPSDYVAASGPLTFNPGQTSRQISIPTMDDTIDEPDETFFVNLSNPVNATLADSQGIGTILDNDPPPTISISDVTVNEGNSGTTSAVFTVTLSSVSEKTISVNYATANGTACSPIDYVGASGTLTFAVGQTSRTITIPVVGDTALEANENFFVNLSNPVNVTLADSQGVGTIFNNDSLPPSPQPLKHFGYIGAVTNSDLTSVSSYTDFTFIDGVYNQSMSSVLTLVNSKSMRAIIDLGQVLWCPRAPGASGPDYHLCTSAETSYTTRWDQWRTMNSAFLNGNNVLAFSVITEPALRNIPIQEVEAAVALVKRDYCQIPTMVAEAGVAVFKPDYQVASNADWVGVVKYYVHPDLDDASDSITKSVERMKSKKQPHQRMVYALDGFYGPPHLPVAPTAADMDTIAQEWYTFASRDPEAILVGVFLWPDLPSENAIGSISFPQNVRDKHKAIGEAIKAGRTPTYQGTFERIDCTSLGGWAWDASQPNTPISVDIYDGTQKIATVRANQFRQDLQNAGIGNGQHAFTFILPASLRNGQAHSITIKYGGLKQQLSSSPRSITCNPSDPVYEGFIDVADCNSIVGWAADRNRLNTSIEVRIYDGNSLVTTVSASDLRSDVGAYLGDNGRHGFAIPTPWQFKDGLPHTLRVKFESSTTELGFSPKTITCSAYYEIVARHSGKCLDVEFESMDAGGLVKQYGCHGGANQQWQVIHVGGGYFKIVARHSGKVLDVQGAGLDNGTPVWQFDENGTAAQQWQIIDVGGGYFKIVARHSGKVLDVAGVSSADGAQIHQWDYVGGGNQQWLLRPVP